VLAAALKSNDEKEGSNNNNPLLGQPNKLKWYLASAFVLANGSNPKFLAAFEIGMFIFRMLI
jgi:hypothetical protein